MPFSEENVLDFVKWLEKSYFVERALGRIEKLLAPEFMMVGTGRREVCYDMPQMRFLLQQEQSGFHDTFLVLSAHYSVRTLTTGGVFRVAVSLSCAKTMNPVK